MPYRQASAANPDLVGAARVKFPTAGKEFKADLAMYAVVGFETVPPAPIGANEDRGDAGLHINTGDARRELCPKGISDRPIARARAEGQPGLSTPDCQVRSLTGGGWPPT